MNSEYQRYLERRKAEHGEKFRDGSLDPRFIPFYHSGQRIKVRFGFGETLTGTVGATTGWAPCFLLMRTSRSIGSPWTLGPEDKIVAVKRGRKYEEVAS